MEQKSNTQLSQRNPVNKMGFGIAIGVGVGTAWGVALGKIAIGVALGIAIGVALGGVLNYRGKRIEKSKGS